MRNVKDDRGSVLVFMTLMIVLLLFMVGIGLDTGQLTYTRSQGQAAVDAAVLSAVSGLANPTNPTAEVENRVAAFNTNNDYVRSPSNTITKSNVTYVQYNDTTGAITALGGIANANGVRVALEQTNPYSGVAAGTQIATPAFLTPVIKLFQGTAPGVNNVNVSAVAALRAIPGIPIAVMQKECLPNGQTKNDVYLRQSNANVDNSCWTTYTDNPPSASKVQALFSASQTCQGIPANLDLITIGTLIELDNGQQASTYAEAKDTLLTNNPNSCWIVPVVPDSTKCNQQDQILDWAKICATEIVKQGNPKYIKANVTCNQGLFRINDNLCFSSRLLRETKVGM